jgi:SAM-dependent methyltransferase
MVASLITWDEKSSERFIEASVYTGFHKSLAQKIIPHLEPGDTLCDVGCGLGRLDFELAPHVSEIQAIDVSEYAIEALRQDAERARVKNLHARCGDADELVGMFDIILMSLYGKADTPELLGHCRRKLIRIVGAGKKSGLYPERYRREEKNAVPVIHEELTALGLKFCLELCAIEFGQPLRTLPDAAQFVLSNAPGAGQEEIDNFLNENLERTGRADFPFYLPYSKELGIFVIDKT